MPLQRIETVDEPRMRTEAQGGPFAARYLGLAAAYLKEQHAVVVSSTECIAVRRYGDYLICSDFDRKTKRLLPTFRLIRPGDVQANFVRIEDLGRLSAPSPVHGIFTVR